MAKILDARFLGSFTGPQAAGDRDIPEVCFVGRSNVGKSSMINALLMRKVARTSSTPGATRLINIYRVSYDFVGERRVMHFSDFPGFGYAKVSRSTYEGWESMVERYILGSPSIRRLIWVYDVRRDPDGMDEAFMDWVAHRRLRTTVVITKTDKANQGLAAKKKSLFRQYFGDDGVFLFSAKEGRGRKELLAHIFGLAASVPAP